MSKQKKTATDLFNTNEIMREQLKILKAFKKHRGKPLRILLSFFIPHWKKLVASAFFFVLKSCPVWAIPLIIAEVVDIAVSRPENAVERFVICAVIAAVVIFQNIPTHMLQIKYFSLAKRDVEAGLRGAMVRRLQQLSIGFHKEMAAGKIQSKVMRDVEAVEALASQLFTTVLSVCTNFIITVSIVLFTNIYVFLMFLVCVPLAVLLMRLFKKKMSDCSRDFRVNVENTSAAVMDMIELVPVSRAHALEKFEIKKITENVVDVAKSGYKFDWVQNLFGAAHWVVFAFFRIVCLIVTGVMAYCGLITVGAVTLYQSYFGDLIGQISSIINLMPIFSKGSEAINSIGEILYAYDVEDNSGKHKLKKLDGEYCFENVYFKYDEDTPVLNGLDLNIKKGETVAFVGESGAGKTTIMNLVIGFNKATSGRLIVDGHDINDLDLHEYRKNISVVPQNTVLFSGTIRDHITYGARHITKAQLTEVIRMARLEKVIEALPNGIDTSIGEHGSKLSGGQRQRIAIARAIIRNPSVIIFDEATSALDSETEREIQAAIDTLSKGRTTFIVAHRLSTIRNADKIAVMRDGVCVEFGSYDELMAKKGEFFHLKSLQA
ncbi:MAG: ABC transporter ATP-binding protein [Oscillospiraceae bacterium]|nr:ABC transporter ATP-binding protein [Oscillospiraceae bacterium]